MSGSDSLDLYICRAVRKQQQQSLASDEATAFGTVSHGGCGRLLEGSVYVTLLGLSFVKASAC